MAEARCYVLITTHDGREYYGDTSSEHVARARAEGAANQESGFVAAGDTWVRKESIQAIEIYAEDAK